VNDHWQWGLKSRVIALVSRRGIEGVVRLNGGEGEGSVEAHLPTVKMVGGLHGVGGARMSSSGGCFCSMKKAGEAGFG
jgi:hypothetical protein